MKQIITDDGSVTFHSDEYDENYHSTSGALEESLKKYVEPCKIISGMKILDIGFGLGYNAAMAMQTADVDIISLEKDKSLLIAIQDLKVNLKSYDMVKQAAKTLSYTDAKSSLKIIIGDATITIITLPENYFDAVFLDAFSPPKNPELWTEEFLKDIYLKMKKGAILATYSCAGIVRRNLKSVGYEVSDGPCVGRKSPGTLARKL